MIRILLREKNKIKKEYKFINRRQLNNLNKTNNLNLFHINHLKEIK